MQEIEIVNTLPPIYDLAHEHFEIDDTCTVYTYGNKLHNPAKLILTEEIIEHEKVHMQRQLQMEGGPKEWWDRYCKEAHFRFDEEANAYGRQLACYTLKNRDRNKRVRYLWQLASILCSPMYKFEEMAHSEARMAIEHYEQEHLRNY